MKLEQQDNRNWLFKYDGTGLTKFLSVLLGLLLLYALYLWTTGAGSKENWEGILGASITLALAAFVFWERSSAQFDISRKELSWSRKYWFLNRKGKIHFADISNVLAARIIGDDDPPSRRIEIISKGKTIPLTNAVFPDTDKKILAMAEQIKSIIGLETNQSQEERAQELQKLGRTIDAIKVLKEETGISTTEAMEKLEGKRSGLRKRRK